MRKLVIASLLATGITFGGAALAQDMSAPAAAQSAAQPAAQSAGGAATKAAKPHHHKGHKAKKTGDGTSAAPASASTSGK